MLFKNSRGLEALATLAVLYVHFQSMLPYCYDQLRLQRAELEAEGEERWLERNLREVPNDAARVVRSRDRHSGADTAVPAAGP